LAEHVDFFASRKFDFVVFDEAQSLKNVAAQRTTAARRLDARFKIALTGTPLENHFDELYSLLDLALPGCLGTLAGFRRTYVNPSVVKPDDLGYLRLKTRPLILRRLKARILSQLPGKTETKVVIPFTERQKKIYRDVAMSWNDRVRRIIESEGETRSQLHMLTALLRLRQVCSCPSALEGVKFKETPPKLEALRESLEEIIESGESVLVFTQFLETYRRVDEMLEESGIPVFGLHGGMSRAGRETALKAFSAHVGGAVMLMTLKTGGVGLNLTKASYVFHIEPWWNPAAENQATDRAHRIGQTKPVQVYRYIMQESVEEKIEMLKERKGRRFAALFGEPSLGEAESEHELESGRTHLTKADFEYLLQ
jgi:SNF2 family DNA or RNA helicase